MKSALVICLALCINVVHAQDQDMALVKGGSYIPLYTAGEEEDVAINSFYMDVTPVTHSEYLAFVKEFPEWRKSKVRPLFADANYLSTWLDDTSVPETLLETPVNNVSWFAAKAYCECQQKRLPTVDEWEYAAMADADSRDARKDSIFNQHVIRTYEARNTHLKKVGNSKANYWGIKDLHGLVWEWTLDFNAIILTGESRNKDNSVNLFCAAGAIGAKDLMNYAAFMRYALRSSLKANYALTNLGFRCVKDVEGNKSLTR